jgi:hypothetical protein
MDADKRRWTPINADGRRWTPITCPGGQCQGNADVALLFSELSAFICVNRSTELTSQSAVAF